MSLCINLNNQNISSSIIPLCSSLSLIQVINCIFFELIRVNDDGGAIYIGWIESNSLISNCYFEKCHAKNGAGFNINSGKNSSIFLNCFFNCSSSNFGQSFIITSFNTNSLVNINQNSFSFCSWNKKGGYLTLFLLKGIPFLKNINNSYSFLSGWTCIYSCQCWNYLESYSTYSFNNAAMILDYAYTFNGLIYKLNIINNSHNLVSAYNSFIYDYDVTNLTLFDSIISFNLFSGYKFLYHSKLIIKNCLLWENNFLTSNISFNPSNIFMELLNNNKCLSLYKLNGITKFKSNFNSFLILLNYLIFP